MNVIEAIRKRYSCRAYQQKAVEPDKLDMILEAARLAPSARNMQDWRFVVVTDSRIRSQVAATTNRPDVFAKAGAIIAACSNSDYVMRCGQAIGPIDVAIALDHITLAAVEMGLGTCWIGAFDEREVKDILGIPKEIRVVALMPIGYPSDPSIVEKRRLPFKEIVRYEHW